MAAEVVSTSGEAGHPSVQPSTQQQQQQLQHNIRKAFEASDLVNKAKSSRTHAVAAIVEDPLQEWRRPKQFRVAFDKNGIIQDISIEEYLSQVEVECGPQKGPKVKIPASAFLVADDTDAWSAAHRVYGPLLFKEVGSSLAQTVSRTAVEACVMFALKRHLVTEGQRATLYSQLAGVHGSGSEEFPVSWLPPLLVVVAHDLAAIWERCTPLGGGKRSVRLFSLELLHVQEQCGLLPTVAKVVAEFVSAGQYHKDGMIAAIEAVCSSDPATQSILKKGRKQVRSSDEGMGVAGWHKDPLACFFVSVCT